MVIMPGCSCCPCSLISRASAVEVELAGEDFLQQFTFKHKFAIGQYAADHEHAVTDAFRGSDYNGTFSLTKVADTGTSSTWEYEWADNAPTCNTPVLSVVLTDADDASDVTIYVQLNIHGLRYVDMASATPYGLNDFDCTLSTITLSGGTISGTLNGVAEGQYAVAKTCSQVGDPIEFSAQVAGWPAFPALSDESGGGTYTITSETLPTDSSLYTPTYASSSVIRYPIVKVLGVSVYA